MIDAFNEKLRDPDATIEDLWPLVEVGELQEPWGMSRKDYLGVQATELRRAQAKMEAVLDSTDAEMKDGESLDDHIDYWQRMIDMHKACIFVLRLEEIARLRERLGRSYSFVALREGETIARLRERLASK